jgi:hypothetical protein
MDGPMIRAIVAALILAGCSSSHTLISWTGGTTKEAYQRDEWECQRDVQHLDGPRLLQLYILCMEAKGYRQATKPK